MKYQITIEKLTDNQDSRYPNREKVYEQVYEETDKPKAGDDQTILSQVIAAVNNLSY